MTEHFCQKGPKGVSTERSSLSGRMDATDQTAEVCSNKLLTMTKEHLGGELHVLP